MNIKIVQGDALEELKKVKDKSVDCILTDPPYFLSKLDDNWKYKLLKEDKPNSHIKHLPKGMKFDKKQTKALFDFYLEFSKICFQKLKPGGWFLSFSAPRLYHAIAMAVDIAGFEIRDAINWVYTQNQPKGMSVNRSINTLNLDNGQKEKLRVLYKNHKTPGMKSCYEPICVAMKPVEGRFIDNELNFNTGLLNFGEKVGRNKVIANVVTVNEFDDVYDSNFLVTKPSKKEKGFSNIHLSVKPLTLIEHLLRIFTKEGSMVIDPFLGSGTTAVACKNLKRKCIGIERESEYIKICFQRLDT
jgi:site-specific DNA-methyltransferase (adenine-specific)